MIRICLWHTWTDHKTNAQIAKELKITQIFDKLLEYKRSWIQHVNRMPRNRLPRVMNYYSPTGRRNHSRPLKRLLDTWDRNGSTSGPSPWKICDDDDDDDAFDGWWVHWYLILEWRIEETLKKFKTVIPRSYGLWGSETGNISRDAVIEDGCLDKRNVKSGLNKERPTWWNFALLFHYLMLNMFRMLTHPSSGACDLFVELFHGLYCSGSMCVGVTLWFGWGGVVSGYHTTPAKPQCNTNTHRTRTIQPMK